MDGMRTIPNDEKTRESIKSWIERGQAIIFPERYEKWEECVKARVSDLFRGADLNDALEIMEALEKGASIEEVKNIFKSQQHSGESASMVRNIVFGFSTKGPDFWEATASKVSPEAKQVLDDKRQENQQLAEAHAKHM